MLTVNKACKDFLAARKWEVPIEELEATDLIPALIVDSRLGNIAERSMLKLYEKATDEDMSKMFFKQLYAFNVKFESRLNRAYWNDFDREIMHLAIISGDIEVTEKVRGIVNEKHARIVKNLRIES